MRKYWWLLAGVLTITFTILGSFGRDIVFAMGALSFTAAVVEKVGLYKFNLDKESEDESEAVTI